MRLWGVSMVRNEADIIETFVRHNLTFLDGLAIVDHRSADDTPQIVGALAREGLPLIVLANDAVAYAQKEITTSALRHVLARTGADFVFPIDADEFIKTPSRARLERALVGIPAGAHGLMNWPTYVPDFDAPYRGILDCARGARRLVESRHVLGKVVVARHFADTPRALLAGGNHAVLPWFGAGEHDVGHHHVLAADDLAIAHLPFRSAGQFTVKIVVNRLARIAAGRDVLPEKQRRIAYRRIADRQPIDAAFLLRMAVNFSVAAVDWIDPDAAMLVDDPFLAEIALRYTAEADVDPMPLVLAAIEQLAGRENAARRAVAARAA